MFFSILGLAEKYRCSLRGSNSIIIVFPGNVLYFFGYKTEFFFLQKQSQRSRSVLQDGSRSLRLFRKGKISIIAKFHRTELVI